MNKMSIKVAALFIGLAVDLTLVTPAYADEAKSVRLIYATPVTQPLVWKKGELEVLQRFTEETGIEVEARNIPFESYDTQVQLSVEGGHPPDVARVNHSTLRRWAGAGYLQRLDDFIDQSEIIEPADYWGGFWEICKVGGKQYAVPLGTDCRVMIYNLRMFRAAGIDKPPTNWMELIEVCERLTDREEKRYGIALQSHTDLAVTYDAIGNFIVANDGEIITPEGDEAVIAQDARSQHAFHFVCDLAVEHKVCPPGIASMSGDIIDTLFVNDRCGITFTGPWAKENYERLDPDFKWREDWDLALIPAAPATGKSGSSQGGWLLGAFEESKYPKESLQLLEFFSRPESLATVAAVENLPPRRAAIDMGPFSDEYYDIFFEQLPYARPPLTCVPQLPNIARAIQRSYQRVVAGGADVDDVIEWLQLKLEHLVEE